MFWIIAILTVVLVLDCLFLTLLVLVQLPKKEAGLGQAFGSSATDALFGAGSGNALTKMTKYATVVFFVLTFSLTILNAQHSKTRRSTLERELQRTSRETPAPVPSTPKAAPAPAATPAAPLTMTTTGLLSAPVTTNAPATAPATTPAKPSASTTNPAPATPPAAEKK